MLDNPYRRSLPWRLVLTVCLAALPLLADAGDPAGEVSEDEADAAPEALAALADTAAAGGGSHTLVLPILGYTPDTSVMLGASVLRFFQLDPAVETSVFSPVLVYTVKKQTIFFLGTNLYWGRQRADIMPGYERFPDQFYGIGRDARKEDEEDYTPEKIELRATWDYEIASDVHLGANYHLLAHRLRKVTDGGLLDSGLVPGVERATLSGPGLQASLDSRDNIWSARSGLWLQGLVRFYGATWGSDYRYAHYETDLRAYLPVGETSVLACQVLATRHDGDAPFFTLPRLGGYDGLRGYRQSRYLDRTVVLARVEWRSGEVLGRFGWVGFAGIGDVAPRPGLLTLAAELWTVGGGLRYTLDERERVKLRLDVGFGNGDSGFYLAFGEAF